MARPEPRLPSDDFRSEVVLPVAVPQSSAATDGRDGSGGHGPGTGLPALGSMPASDRSVRHESLPPLVLPADLVQDAPPWLLSAVLHMLAVILLGLLSIAHDLPDELLLQFGDAESGLDGLATEDLDLSIDLATPEFDTNSRPQQLSMASDSLVDSEALNLPAFKHADLAGGDPIRRALSGREKGMQQALLDAYGGTRGTQRAVMDALRWLARNQQKQGLWSMRGRYADGAPAENMEAATALALLAFQGAGFTPSGDPIEPYTKLTNRAWNRLLKQQDEDGNFFHEGRRQGQLYTQAMCTIALCEVYAMTQDSRFREPAQRSVDYCVRIQAPEGGWRYNPGSDSDLSVTGWFVMALQSARMAGLEVPTPTLDRISGFLDLAAREEGSFYSYRAHGGATRSMTAEGLLCRQFLGWNRYDSRLELGTKYLIQEKNLPTWEKDERDVYYWYYATQVCHHMEGEYWRKWNETMRVVLPENQIRDGKEQGSWDPKGDEWGREGGRLFVTCLSTYMLEVYYRHLPIYRLEMLQGPH